MNSERRKQIKEAIRLIEGMAEAVGEAEALVSQAYDEESEYYENMPEGLQAGDKGTQAEAAVEALSEVHSALEDFDPENLVSRLEEALE